MSVRILWWHFNGKVAHEISALRLPRFLMARPLRTPSGACRRPWGPAALVPLVLLCLIVNADAAELRGTPPAPLSPLRTYPHQPPPSSCSPYPDPRACPLITRLAWLREKHPRCECWRQSPDHCAIPYPPSALLQPISECVSECMSCPCMPTAPPARMEHDIIDLTVCVVLSRDMLGDQEDIGSLVDWESLVQVLGLPSPSLHCHPHSPQTLLPQRPRAPDAIRLHAAEPASWESKCA